jgi:hypothetical protein
MVAEQRGRSERPVAPSAHRPLLCPFCGAAEQERLPIEDKLVVIFPCMFSPVLAAGLSEEQLKAAVAAFSTEGTGYFQKQCDRLHYFVTKGAGAVLPDPPGRRGAPGTPSSEP